MHVWIYVGVKQSLNFMILLDSGYSPTIKMVKTMSKIKQKIMLPQRLKSKQEIYTWLKIEG